MKMFAFSEDTDIQKLGTSLGTTVKSVADLPFPPRPSQGSMLFEK
jgi:fibrillarin-like rRNA methylase